MIQVNLDFENEEFRQILRQEIKNAVGDILRESQHPTLLTRDQLKEFLGIGDTKASELLNRQDFPVTREFGRPKVPTHLLMKWIEEHTDWVEQHTSFFPKRVI